MVYYYLFMALLITALVLWAVVAIREDTPAEDDAQDKTPPPKNGDTPS